MKLKLRFKGGPDSGHRGHSGRPGQRGGSLPGKGGGAGKQELLDIYVKANGVDQWGDPLPTVNNMMTSAKVLDGIMADDRMKKLAVALAADGDVASLDNFDALKGTDLVGAMMGVDPEMEGAYSTTAIGKHMHTHFVRLYDEYDAAASDPGHWQETAKMTPARIAWEKKYYGKKVGGHSAGQKYAISELNKYIASTK